ncbi:MAG: hypothetical protein ACMUJM_01785 [bacterium]
MSAGVELIPLTIMLLMKAAHAAQHVKNNPVHDTITIHTGFSEKEQLSEALEEIGYEVTCEDDKIIARSDHYPEIHLVKEGETYKAVFSHIDENQCAALMKKITASYMQSCQKDTYRKIIDTIDKKGFTIKNEEFLPDQTIRLRVSVN